MARTLIEAQRSASRTKISKSKRPNAKFPQKLYKPKRAVLTTEERAEMEKLAQLLPSRMQAANREVDPFVLINDVTRYINHLTATIVTRVKNGSLPEEALLRPPPQRCRTRGSRSEPWPPTSALFKKYQDLLYSMYLLFT
ncbi:hypothetical protein L596_004997 [Steinernema carpocapsae]|uniref:Uncharacterized protein n=1 Tax=Steinernema carpocapsae TaxID=34508 RepID=A0A4U8V1T4_STECR|nr:hypothetical protein L596_004997 [Steinernema carpocapsae]